MFNYEIVNRLDAVVSALKMLEAVLKDRVDNATAEMIHKLYSELEDVSATLEDWED